MLTVLRNPTYTKLFAAQVIALLGTGLLTVALGLLAFDIAGQDAGRVLGIAMSVKMVAYVGVSPLSTALTARLPRKPVLISADLIRATVAVLLPFVTQSWQIYLLVLLLQAASATFTPTFQAVIPAVLPDEGEFTQALSLSRLAYDLEAVVSPVLVVALLTVVSYHSLFVGTVFGFLGSAILVLASRLPRIEAPAPTTFADRLTRGSKAFWSSDELRSLLGLNLVVATTTAMVIVNTVVLVQGDLGRPQADVALMLGVYGGGSMAVALCLPKVLRRWSERRVMLAGATALPVSLLAVAGLLWGVNGEPLWIALLAAWFLSGAATSSVLTPSARLLRRNSTEQTRPAVFAAQFSFSHACFLATYPIAGALGAETGLVGVAVVLAVIGLVGLGFATDRWPPPSRGSGARGCQVPSRRV